MMLTLMYAANVIVAGWVGITSAFFPKSAATSVFQGAYPPSDVMRLVGCLWCGIFVLSLLGLWRPVTFAPVLLLQLVYKGMWLVLVAAPAYLDKRPLPTAMVISFIAWVLVLPFVIPWGNLFGKVVQ